MSGGGDARGNSNRSSVQLFHMVVRGMVTLPTKSEDWMGLNTSSCRTSMRSDDEVLILLVLVEEETVVSSFLSGMGGNRNRQSC